MLDITIEDCYWLLTVMDEEYLDGPLLLSFSSFFSPPSKYLI
jgi:hypothetical protein